ncbi:TraX family protein [Marinobacterium lutimaris]|uniref:TraX protein n=1 Tax=Marinobacterium lutimaris TaxID=568106 RepID=A0A1H6AKZ1_9GAMM|nr:TraX family protein [Marinobacterium lutimaris]SEG49211.1 TraX protein [Marinobacterium lutimaris]
MQPQSSNDIVQPSMPVEQTARNKNVWVAYAQWIAIITMTLEHSFHYLWPDSPLAPWTQTAGRTAFPLFAALIAWHLVHNTRRPYIYGLRVLVLAAISQIPYFFVMDNGKLNVCFTLALGLLAFATVDRIDKGALKLLAAGGMLLLALAVNPYFEYKLWGLLLVPAFAFGFRYRDQLISLVPALTICALINHAQISILISFLTGCAVFAVSQANLDRAPIPGIPRWLRQSWYPLHLGVIGLVVAF